MHLTKLSKLPKLEFSAKLRKHFLNSVLVLFTSGMKVVNFAREGPRTKDKTAKLVMLASPLTGF